MAPPGQLESDLDQITAHLDRGWDLIQKGDFHGAEKSARRILKIDKRAPEGHLLLGAAKSGLDDAEAAMDHFEKAIELDPDYVEPYLHAADTCLAVLDDPERALQLVDDALELVSDDDDARADALLLKADAELLRGDQQGARAALGELGDAPFEEPSLHLRAGRLWLEAGDLARSEREIKRLLERNPETADGWHALGLVHEQRGDFRKMAECWLKVWKLDKKGEPPPWAIDEATFEQMAEQALAELPERIRTLLANVPILVSDVPSLEIVAEGNDPRMMGFFSGVPYPEKSTMGGPAPHLDCIFLYQRNIERASRAHPEMLEEIRKTLLHETGHFFGLSEQDLEDIGLG